MQRNREIIFFSFTLERFSRLVSVDCSCYTMRIGVGLRVLIGERKREMALEWRSILEAAIYWQLNARWCKTWPSACSLRPTEPTKGKTNGHLEASTCRVNTHTHKIHCKILEQTSKVTLANRQEKQATWSFCQRRTTVKKKEATREKRNCCGNWKTIFAFQSPINQIVIVILGTRLCANSNPPIPRLQVKRPQILYSRSCLYAKRQLTSVSRKRRQQVSDGGEKRIELTAIVLFQNSPIEASRFKIQ